MKNIETTFAIDDDDDDDDDGDVDDDDGDDDDDNASDMEGDVHVDTQLDVSECCPGGLEGKIWNMKMLKRWMDEWVGGMRMNRCIDERMDGWVGGMRMNRCIDERMDGWMSGWKQAHTKLISCHWSAHVPLTNYGKSSTSTRTGSVVTTIFTTTTTTITT